MANQKIHEYLLEKFSIGDDDYFDIDFYNGSSYETAKVKGIVIKALASAINIYNSDGTLTADRILTGSNFELLFQSLGAFIVESHKNNIDNVIFEVRTQSGFDSFTIKDHVMGDNLFNIRNGTIKILNQYLLPSVDGTSGQVITTDGVGNATFQNAPNIYNNDGTLTGNRTVDGNQFILGFTDLQAVVFQIVPPIVPPYFEAGMSVQVDTQFLATGNGRPFEVVRSQDSHILFASVEDGRVNVNDVYYLPNVAGTIGQVLTAGAGSVVNWNSIYNQQIQDEGANITQRNIINFVGAGVTVTDLGSKTTVTIPGATSLTDAWIPFSEPGLYATNQTFFMSTGIFQGTESLVQMPFPACRIKNFKINVTSNTANNATTIEVRRNGVAILTTSIPGNTNGVFTATGLVSVALNDLISIRVVIPAGGTGIGLRGAMLNYEI